MQGWRMGMEDAKLCEIEIPDNAMCFGVFDGHGGREVAVFVAKHFCAELLANEHYKNGNIEIALQETYMRMDEKLRSKEGQQELVRIQRGLPDNYSVSVENAESLAGCTAVAALVKDSKLHVANAGDSRCVLARGGKAVEMTVDHKPDNEHEHNRIVRAGGYVEDGRVVGNLNLSRSIGDLEYKKNPDIPAQDQMITAFPEVKVETITQDSDFMILACDGIWDMLSNQQCVDIVYEGLRAQKELSDIVEGILDRCLASDVASSGGLGCDNMTCIIVKFNH